MLIRIAINDNEIPHSRLSYVECRIQGTDVCGGIVAVGHDFDRSRIGECLLLEPVFREPVGWRNTDLATSARNAAAPLPSSSRDPAVNARKITSPLSYAEFASFPWMVLGLHRYQVSDLVVAGSLPRA
jgi:hypothetical protein